MALEWCQPCKARGRLSIASHEVAGTLMCGECFGGEPSNGVKTALAAEFLKKKSEDTTMKHTSEETRAAVLKDAAAGMNVEQIRLKNGVGWMTAKKIIDDGGGARAKKAKRGRPANGAAGFSNGNGSVTLHATPELLNAVWAALTLEKKAALLNQLSALEA